MQKGGIQLSVNMLVTIIIGVMILTGGIYLTQRITKKASTIANDIPKQLEDRLFNVLLGPNDRIAVIENVRDTDPGEDVVFPIGLQNLLEFEKTEFRPVLTNTKPVVAPKPPPYPDCRYVADPNKCPSLQLLDTRYELRRFDKVAFVALVKVPPQALPGEYTFDVAIESTKYDDGNGWVFYSGPYAKTKVHINVH